jgi:UDP-glucose/iron transport system permease protein
MSAIDLSGHDLALAALLLLINGAISLTFGLRLEARVALAAVRMTVQLAAIAFILKFVFAQTSPLWTLVVALAMVLVAGYELMRRQGRRFSGWWAYGLGNATLLLVGGLATLYAAAGLIGPQPWYAPRYVLPILAMVLAATLTSVSLALQTLTEGAEQEREAIEARIALGATRFGAFSPLVRRALGAAITPLLNTMSLAGMVTLPGLMTGQILAGADPVEAAKYQIVIMLVLSGASGLGALIAAFGGVLLLTDSRHRLRLDCLAPARA